MMKNNRLKTVVVPSIFSIRTYRNLYRNISLILVIFLCLLSADYANTQVSLTATAGTGSGSFTTLKGAFDAINAGTHRGAISIRITANTTETTTATLNASLTGSASYSAVSIQPSGGGARTITGAIAAGSALINLNGADNVTIDGLNSGGNSLVIQNTTASPIVGTTTIQLINGATTNTITNTDIRGSYSGNVGGTVQFKTDAMTANGNDDNTISFNNIGPAGSNLSSIGIYMLGTTTTTAIGNSGNIINGNNIFDYFSQNVSSSGINIGAGTPDINITNNRFYQTATRGQQNGLHSAIWINSTSGNNFKVTGNTIGYASSAATGNYTITGIIGVLPIGIYVGQTTVVNVSDNIITNLVESSVNSGANNPHRMIYISGGAVNCNNNTIGSQSATSAIVIDVNSGSHNFFVGIHCSYASSLTTNNNTIGGVATSKTSGYDINFEGIFVESLSAGSWWLCQNNTIGGTVANSINVTSASGSNTVRGIFGYNNQSATITGNIIRNMTTTQGMNTGTSTAISGIVLLSTTTSIIGSNTIYNLKNSFGTTVSGIICNTYGSSTIEKNFIYDLDASHTSAVMNGIDIISGTSTYRNNMIRLGGSGSSVSIGFQINGINETGGNNSIYFNSIYLGGTPASGSANSFGLRSSVTGNTRAYQNNIFFNARSNSGSTGKHYAISTGGTAPNPSGLTSNYNILLAPGTGGNIGLYNGADRTTLGAWNTATGQDANSQNADPFFVAPTAATPDLHIQTSVASPADATGVAIASVTDDFDGNTRAGLTPVDIGADAFVGLPTIVSFTPAVLCATGGQTVTITGTGFVSVSAVRFNGVNAASYTVVNSTTITAVTPAGVTSGNITVTTSGGTATSPTAYINNADPSSVQSATGMALSTGDYLWSGNTSIEWGVISNWYQYNGTDFLNPINLPNYTTNVFILPSSTPGTCISSVNQPEVISTGGCTNLFLGAGATLKIHAGINLDVYGNWINNGTFNPTTGNVSFSGTNPQTIGGSSVIIFFGMLVNKTSASITLNKPVTVTDLVMYNGKINTTAANLLTIGASPASPGALYWYAGTIIGPLKRFYAAAADASQEAGIFPVGNATYNRYAMVNFTANPGGGFITAEYKSGVCPVGYNGLVATINGQFITNYENEGYWEITPNGGNLNTTNYNLILRGNHLSTVNNLGKLRIIKSSNHIAWNDNPAGDGDHLPATGLLPDFTIGATSMKGFSWFNIGSDNANPLPVELTDFSAHCNGKSGVVLKWSTASEENSQQFILEKSRDMVHWGAIAHIPAAGNSNYKLNYRETDEDPLNGVGYYRLVQVDNNGETKEYETISVSCENGSNSLQVFPNPSEGDFHVEIVSTENNSNAILQLADVTGKIITNRPLYLIEGQNLFLLDGIDLEMGTYMIKLYSGNENQFEPVRIVIN